MSSYNEGPVNFDGLVLNNAQCFGNILGGIDLGQSESGEQRRVIYASGEQYGSLDRDDIRR